MSGEQKVAIEQKVHEVLKNMDDVVKMNIGIYYESDDIDDFVTIRYSVEERVAPEYKEEFDWAVKGA